MITYYQRINLLIVEYHKDIQPYKINLYEGLSLYKTNLYNIFCIKVSLLTYKTYLYDYYHTNSLNIYKHRET